MIPFQRDFLPGAGYDQSLSLNSLWGNRYALAAGNPVTFVEVGGHQAMDPSRCNGDPQCELLVTNHNWSLASNDLDRRKHSFFSRQQRCIGGHSDYSIQRAHSKRSDSLPHCLKSGAPISSSAVLLVF